MKAQTIRNATEAHGWIGIIISIALFIVFWAGSITLFYPELQRWATLPHFPLDARQIEKPIDELVQTHLKHYELDNSRLLRIIPPGDRSPYLELRVPVLGENENSKEVNARKTNTNKTVTLFIDPYSGRKVMEGEPFHLADFLYELHINLNLPQGTYIVGLVTFFFMVILFTGIVIQLKNLIRHFFMYRIGKSLRYKMNDLHNIVGVITLPYGLMFALTGLMFNLGIVFQIPTMFALYDGDSNKMLKDAGFYSVLEKPSGKALSMPNIDVLIASVETEYDAETRSIIAYNYGDENVVIRVIGRKNGTFAKRVDQFYEVKSQSYPEQYHGDEANAFRDGSSVFFSLHFGNYAGFDLRFLYFMLGIGVCGMIVAGNVLWLVKRQKEESYAKTKRVVSFLTLGGSLGCVVATAGALFLERVLPVGLAMRADVVAWGFGAILALTTMFAVFSKRTRFFIGSSLLLSGGTLGALVLIDFTVYLPTLYRLFFHGYSEVFGFSVGLFLTSIILCWVGQKLLNNNRSERSTIEGTFALESN